MKKMQTWKMVSVLSPPLTFKDCHNVLDPVIISDLLRVYTLPVRLGAVNLDSSIPFK